MELLLYMSFIRHCLIPGIIFFLNYADTRNLGAAGFFFLNYADTKKFGGCRVSNNANDIYKTSKTPAFYMCEFMQEREQD